MCRPRFSGKRKKIMCETNDIVEKIITFEILCTAHQGRDTGGAQITLK
jgi:hypothetical protein